MSKLEEIHRLVHSLKKSEKRFFKLFSSMQVKSDKNNYVKLFDAIAKISLFDEDKITKQFIEEGGDKKYYYYVKNYLYDFILKSISVSSSDSYIDRQIRELITYTEILFEKGLYDQCYKMLYRLKKMVDKYDRIYYRFLSFSFEEFLIGGSFISNETDKYGFKFSINSNKRLDEKKKMFRGALDEVEIVSLIQQFKNILKGIQTKKDELIFQKIENKVLLLKDKYINQQNLSDSKAVEFVLLEMYFFYTNDLERLLIITDKYLKTILHYKNVNPQIDYTRFNVMRRYGLTCLFLRKFNSASNTINDLKQFSENSFLLKMEKETQLLVLECLFYASVGKFSKGVSMVKEIESDFEKYDIHISNRVKALKHFVIAYTYFGNNQYDKALIHNNEVLNNLKFNFIDLRLSALLLNVLIHYDLDNYILLESIVPNCHKQIIKYDKSDLGKEIAESIKQFLKDPVNNKEQIKMLIKLKERIDKYNSKPFQSLTFRYVDFHSWLDSKINNINLGEAIQKRYPYVKKQIKI